MNTQHSIITWTRLNIPQNLSLLQHRCQKFKPQKGFLLCGYHVPVLILQNLTKFSGIGLVMKRFVKFLQVRVVRVPSSQLSLSALPSQELRRALFLLKWCCTRKSNLQIRWGQLSVIHVTDIPHSLFAISCECGICWATLSRIIALDVYSRGEVKPKFIDACLHVLTNACKSFM